MTPAPPSIAAYLMSCAERRAVRARTVANLACTDWGAPPGVALDREQYDDPKQRGSDTAHHLLELAMATRWDLLLFLEDDLEFNVHLRHALEHWAPVAARSPAGHPFASLYNPGVDPLPAAAHGSTWFVAHPERSYGSQAYLVVRPTVAHVLEHGDDGRGYHDIRMTRLRGAGDTAALPPAVAGAAPRGASTIGGVPHEAADFDADWCPLVWPERRP